MPETEPKTRSRKWVQWSLILLILALVAISALTRLAGLYYLKGLKNESATFRFPEGQQTVEGVSVRMEFVRPDTPYFSAILDTDYTIVLVHIRNAGTTFFDYQPMDFFMELPDKHVFRPFDREELLESLTTGLIGTVLAPASMNRINQTRKLVRMTYLPSARLFPGYERTGIVAFPHIQGFPSTFGIRLTQLSLGGKPVGPILFKAVRVDKSPQTHS